MTPTILKILLVSIWESKIPFTTWTKNDRFGNCFLYSAHQVKGLKGFTCIRVVWKNPDSTLKSPIITFSIESKDPNLHQLLLPWHQQVEH